MSESSLECEKFDEGVFAGTGAPPDDDNWNILSNPRPGWLGLFSVSDLNKIGLIVS